MGNTKNDKVESPSPSSKNGSNSKKNIAIFITIGIVLITVVILLLLKPTYLKPNNEGDGYYMTEENVDDITDKIESDVAAGYFETYMNTVWTFPNKKSVSTDAVFGNSQNNSKPIRCYVELKATGERIYESGVIPVGKTLSQIKLNTTLKPGSYDAVCNVVLMDSLEDGSYKDASTAGFDITINVLK